METDTAMIPLAYLELIRTVEERGSHSFTCESSKQAERIKSQFYRVRDELLKVGDTRAVKMMVAKAEQLDGTVILEIAMRVKDEELILNSIASQSSPVADLDGSLNRFLTLAHAHIKGIDVQPDANAGGGVESEGEPIPPGTV